MWEIFLLYGFLLFSEGFINFFFQGAWKITNMIHMAELDRFLVRPVPVGLQLLTAKIDFDGLNKMVIAAAVLFVGFGKCEIQWDMVKILLLFVFLGGSVRRKGVHDMDRRPMNAFACSAKGGFPESVESSGIWKRKRSEKKSSIRLLTFRESESLSMLVNCSPGKTDLSYWE